MSETSLLKKAAAGEARFYLQFGGQGGRWFPELARYYSNPAFGRFFDTIFAALEEERPRVEGSIGLPRGLDLPYWLKDPDSIPSQDYLSSAAISLPLIQVTQMAHLENLYLTGIGRQDLLRWSTGATGHSQGIVTAAFVSLGLEGDDYYAALAQFTKYQLYIGVSAQKTHPQLDASPEEIEESQDLDGSIPSPMAAILGSDHKTVESMVGEINPDLQPDRKIYLSLYNSPTNIILSSYRSSLVAFHKKYRRKIDAGEFKFVYLPTTCPFHCALMEPMRSIMEAEIRHIGFKCSGQDLSQAVYSFYDQANYQDIGEELSTRMYEDLMIHPLYWDKALRPVAQDPTVSHILDFGPGKTTQRLSTDTLRGLGSEKPVIALALTRDLKML